MTRFFSVTVRDTGSGETHHLSALNRARWHLYRRPLMNWRIACDLRARRRGVQRFALLQVPFPTHELPDLQSDEIFSAEGYRFYRVARPGFIRVRATSRRDLMAFISDYVIPDHELALTQDERDAQLRAWKREIVRVPRRARHPRA